MSPGVDAAIINALDRIERKLDWLHAHAIGNDAGPYPGEPGSIDDILKRGGR